MDQWQPEPVTIVGEPQTARLTMPSPTAPLLARPSRQTTKLEFKPPSLGKYHYWDVRPAGYKLDYKKRDKSFPGGWRYLYLGFWSRADMLALMVELSPEDFLKVLRVDAGRNARRYLERKRQNGN